MRRMLLALCVLSSSLAAISCKKIPEAEEFRSMDRIPAEYGELVNVTPFGPKPYQAVLWFEKPDQTIVAVRVNLLSGKISDEYLAFPRQ